MLSRFTTAQLATDNLIKEEDENSINNNINKKYDYNNFNKWIIFDGNLNETSFLDQIVLFKGISINSNANNSKLPGIF
jgi:hypothetical protein